MQRFCSVLLAYFFADRNTHSTPFHKTMIIALLSRMVTTATNTSASSSYPSMKTKMFLVQREDEGSYNYNVDYYEEESSIPTCSCHSSFSSSFSSSSSSSSSSRDEDDDATDLGEYLTTVASSWNPAGRRRRNGSGYILPDRLPKGNEIECMPSSCLMTTATSSRNNRREPRQLDSAIPVINAVNKNNSSKAQKKSKKNSRFVRAVVDVLSGNSERRQR